jgi:hypothetical protein
VSNLRILLRSLPRVLLINILVFLLLAVVLESATRVFVWLKWGETAYLKYGVKYPAVNFSHVSPLYYHDMGDYLAFRPMKHPAVIWAAGEVYINQYGFRTKDFTVEKPFGIYRILAIGESSTFGFHVSDDKTWPYLLNEKYKTTSLDHKKVEVINLGLPWYNSEDNLNLLNFALTLKPDLVIYYGAANDIVDLGLRRLRQDRYPAVLRYITTMERYSLFLYKGRMYLQSSIDKIALSKRNSIQAQLSTTYFQRDLIENSAVRLFIDPFEANIKKVQGQVKDHNAKFVLVSQLRAPLGKDWIKLQKEEMKYDDDLKAIEEKLNSMNFYSYGEYLSLKLSTEQRLNVIETIQYIHSKLVMDLGPFAMRNDMLLLDFVKAVGGDFSYLTTDLHLTEQGNEELANALFNYLNEQFCKDGSGCKNRVLTFKMIPSSAFQNHGRSTLNTITSVQLL